MSDIIAWISQAWAEIEFVSEWTGLSVGLLLGLGALVYFDPALRKVAIRTGVAIVVAYIVLMYGYHTGMAEKAAQWQAANRRAAAEEHLRDKAAANDAAAAAAQEAGVLSVQRQKDQEQIDALRNIDAACHPISRDELQ